MITGVSPSELLFGSKIRTKLPELIDYNFDDIAVHDRDAEMKEKGRLYADMHRGAKVSDIHSGDKVIVKQDRENKMSTRFNPSPFKVVERNGNSVVVESDQGVQCRRNVTHLIKFHERENTGLQDSVSLENTDLVLPENESSPESPFDMSKRGSIHDQESESNLSSPC